MMNLKSWLRRAALMGGFLLGLAAQASAQGFVGDATDGQVYLGVSGAPSHFATMSGDATISNTGVLTLATSQTGVHTWTQAQTFLSGILLRSSAVAHNIGISSNDGTLTADRTINFTVSNGNRSVGLAGDLSLNGAFSTSGVNAITLTSTGTTNVTLPTTGTLATLAGLETLTNKTLTTPAVNGGAIAGVSYFSLKSTGTGAQQLIFASSEALTAPRTISYVVGDTDRTLTLTANASIGGTHSGTSSGTNTGDQTITLTGDATGSGTGSFATTLATVNTNTGSFGSSTAIPNFTVNGKGLLTAAGSSAVIAPAGTLSGTTLAATVVTSSLTSVGTLATGVWQGTIVGPTYGGTGINNGSFTHTLAGSLSTPAVVQGDLWYGSAAGVISALAKNASSTRYLSNTGASNGPAWAQVDLTSGVTGTLPIANGGTNDNGSAWTTYSPGITCVTGSPTVGTNAGRYKTLGKTIWINISIQISAVSTCSGGIKTTVPFNPQAVAVFSGAETQINGKAAKVTLNAGSTTTSFITYYDNTDPGAGAATLTLTGVYETQ